MKAFEISSKKNRNGRRHFRAILHQIYPDSCVDEVNQVGTEYNKNGITWIKEYCEAALPSIEGMSIRCEFVDEDRTELLGHGNTGIVDGEPVYEDAVVLGTFTKGYIDEIDTENGVITACIGEGEIDAQCYHNFVTKLEEGVANDIFPNGSVEIMHPEDGDQIVYKYGYKDEGRIPMNFIYSGFALLGVKPADDSAKLIELNEEHKEDLNKMNENEIKALAAELVSQMNDATAEMNQYKADCDARVAEVNEALEKAIAEKNELTASSQQIQEALDACRNEINEKNKELDSLWNELNTLRDELGQAKARERISELNAAISEFTDAEKEYAKDEIEAFNANPMTAEINSVVNKIWEGIGKAAKANEQSFEQNSANETDIEDIFSEVVEDTAEDEDVSIF